jgi:multiple sugar transport system substrate-binding protein
VIRRAALLVLAAMSSAAAAGTLVVNANTSDPVPRAAWEAAVQRFQRAHPEVQVRLNVYDHESYKRSIRNWLTGIPPDVVFWFAGHRMRQFVAPNLLEDVTDLYSDEVRAALHQAGAAYVRGCAGHRRRHRGNARGTCH